MGKAAEFMTRNGFDLTKFDNDALLDLFMKDMDTGLAGDKSSSLAMIPAYIGLPAQLPRNRKVAVLDAGGTNLRAALIAFDANGKAGIEKIVKSEMPGSKKEVTADEFYNILTEQLLQVMPPEIDRIGFCFSYPAEITEKCDAKLLFWSKQIKAPEVVGQYVGTELKKRLAAKGRKAEIVILNDTVATLLAGYTEMPAAESFVGFILGTGTNTAYLENTAAITKCPGAQKFGAQMSVNVESGHFAKLPRTAFDIEFDKTTQDTGKGLFEKALSGVYMGGVALAAMKAAAKEGIFSAAAAKEIDTLSALNNKDIDDFGANVAGCPLFAGWDDADKTAAREITKPLYERAARLTAVNIAVAAIRGGKKSVCVNIDGSTYYKTKTVSFPEIVTRELDKMLKPRGIAYKLIKVDEAPVFGAAVAALTV